MDVPHIAAVMYGEGSLPYRPRPYNALIYRGKDRQALLGRLQSLRVVCVSYGGAV